MEIAQNSNDISSGEVSRSFSCTSGGRCLKAMQSCFEAGSPEPEKKQKIVRGQS